MNGLAQQGLTDPKLFEFLSWTAGVGATIVVLGVIAGLWIGRLRRPDGPAGPASGFSLADLRRLHQQGKLTDEQFARAKGVVIAGMAIDEESFEAKEGSLAGPADNTADDGASGRTTSSNGDM